jgi:hypothetical protein
MSWCAATTSRDRLLPCGSVALPGGLRIGRKTSSATRRCAWQKKDFAGFRKKKRAYVRSGIGIAGVERTLRNPFRLRSRYTSATPKLSGTQRQRTMDMRLLLSGVAIVAALAIAAPAFAQRSGPGPGAQTTTGPGVYPPGGPGPSSSLYNLPASPPGVPGTAPWGTPAPQTTTSPAVSPRSR